MVGFWGGRRFCGVMEYFFALFVVQLSGIGEVVLKYSLKSEIKLLNLSGIMSDVLFVKYN